MKKDRICPCGSKIAYNQCCKVPQEGETAIDIKDKVQTCIINTFEAINETRGELCLYVSMLVKDLLEYYNIRSYIVGGEARWKDYPHYYKWNPQKEFHVWDVTQYGEMIDLTCDSFETRHDANTSVGPLVGIKSPDLCLGKVCNDRNYTSHDLGCKNIKRDKRGYEKVKKIAFELLLDG